MWLSVSGEGTVLIDEADLHLHPRWQRTLVANLRRYVGVDAAVVYPPVDTRMFQWLGQKDYFLSTARLDPLKRVDVVVNAFLQMPDKKLVVVSGGSESDRIRHLADGAANIRILGWVDGVTLQHLMGNCIATIYIPKDEDFGISPVESMAAGKPVIGVAEGGLLETVKDGETGVLLRPDVTAADIQDAVKQMTAPRTLSMRKECEARAELFTRERFVVKMTELIS